MGADLAVLSLVWGGVVACKIGTEDGRNVSPQGWVVSGSKSWDCSKDCCRLYNRKIVRGLGCGVEKGESDRGRYLP